MPKKMATPWRPHRVESASLGTEAAVDVLQLFITQTSPAVLIAARSASADHHRQLSYQL